MRIIDLTKGAVAVVDDEDYDRLAEHKWYLTHNGYAAREKWIGKKQNGKPHHHLILMQRAIMEPYVEDISVLQVRHLTGDWLDNRKSNLRTTVFKNRMKRKQEAMQEKCNAE